MPDDKKVQPQAWAEARGYRLIAVPCMSRTDVLPAEGGSRG